MCFAGGPGKDVISMLFLADDPLREGPVGLPPLLAAPKDELVAAKLLVDELRESLPPRTVDATGLFAGALAADFGAGAAAGL